jgi:hypothetical protein
MTPIKTWTEDGVTIDFHPEVYDEFQRKYKDISEFIETLQDFTTELAINKESYNINPYQGSFNKGIYILGKDDYKLGIFPSSKLAIKCSQGKLGAENVRKQFYRTMQLEQEFDTKLNVEEKKLLQICPVYLHIQTRQANSFFKQVLVMPKIAEAVTLGHSQTGFSAEFCEVFNIPSLDEIRRRNQFALHRHLDKNKRRQLLKIQTVYLFKRLLSKGIKICSLNQKNVLVDRAIETGQTTYTIIDPIEDLFPPLSPLYNTVTMQLCT